MNWKAILTICAILLATFAETAAAGKEDPLDAARIAIRKREFSSAIKIWRSEARKGNSEAQYQLAVAYRAGRGVERNDESSVSWLRPAAKAGHAAAQYQLGVMLQKGWGVEIDRTQALALFKQASRSGHLKAREHLKSIYQSESRIGASGEARLLAVGDDPNEQLLQAIRLGDLQAVKDILSRGAEANGDPEERERPRPILEAVRLKKGNITTELLRAGARAHLTKRAPDEESALVLAIESGDIDLVECILKFKFDLDAQDNLGRTALMHAALRDRDAAARLLLKKGAKTNLTLPDGRTALSLALDAQSGRVAVVLRRNGAVEGRSELGGRQEWLSGSLEGAGATSLSLVGAAAKGKTDLVRELLARGSKVGSRDREGYTALCRAAARGHSETVSFLLRKGADTEARSGMGQAPLHEAAAGDHLAVTTSLLRWRANVMAKNSSGATPLHLASQFGAIRVIDVLLRNGAKVDAVDGQNRIPLEVAVNANQVGAIGELLSHKHETKLLDRAMCGAAARSRPEALRVMLASGANADLDCGGDSTALILASGQPSHEVVEVLVNAGVEINRVRGEGNSALIVAASLGLNDTVTLLLGVGADVDARGFQKTTALIRAASAGHVETARILLDGGANSHSRDAAGNNALALARESGHTEMVDLIQSAGSGLGSLFR